MSVTEEPPSVGTPRPRLPRRLGLSGKLLLLTIPLVMIAGMMIYVPAIANFRINRLNDRLAAANTAALVLDAAPLGMVPDSLARQILKSIGARAVAIKMGQQRRLLASADLPAAIDHDVDLREMTAWSAIVESFETMLETGNQSIRVVGPAPGGAQFIEVVVDRSRQVGAGEQPALLPHLDGHRPRADAGENLPRQRIRDHAQRGGVQHQCRGIGRRQTLVEPVHPEIRDRRHVDQQPGDHDQGNGEQQQLAGQAKAARRPCPRHLHCWLVVGH